MTAISVLQATDPWTRNEVNFRRLLRACENQIQDFTSEDFEKESKVRAQLKTLTDLLKAFNQAEPGSHKFTHNILVEYKKKVELLERLFDGLIKKEKTERRQEEQSNVIPATQIEAKTNDQEPMTEEGMLDVRSSKRVFVKSKTGDTMEIRNRNRRQMLFGTRNSLIMETNIGDKSLEETIKREESLQNSLLGDIFDAVGNMKQRVQGINEEIQLDNQKLDHVQDAFEKNLDKTLSVQKKLDIAIASTTSSCKAFIFICVAFFLAILFMKLIPKQR
mmetsp:Transcript_12195/g.15159  ORF Transcript_12195/g.15159 Transcript_12195/m.15159 type:complete len:276 (+) Transcript_12195:422-1249(+)|eukprot:CAMPEP_0204824498 /NCGR_PEP_ID=MMETSP1346-20131115/2505_1 /ASSEMBLY_ACC=CAM_ASM_000771 /TAXON_ID=215587 /ORGANISM="Aplanochytrium stocchinoi, Strain GSBS06" /LENGTH=275 /DNA_ID=CAMNT_0051951671 /DNA_START=639 /DNA_END=1466 /DNA_ORIENTATION=+